MVATDVTETSKSLAVAGGYVSIVGLVSYFLKERLFISEALLATLIGIATGPIALNWFNPFVWSSDQEYLTHQITRVIIAIQVLFTGIALPKAYLRTEWMSLATLLGPVMTTAWFICGLLIWALIPGLTFLESLVVGSCVTPTDPVLANSICKGRFAEKHVPLHVRNLIVAESGANDGLGFPFLYIGLYLILIHEPSHPRHSIGGAVGEWFYNIVLYQIVLSCIIGTVIGYIARKVLRFAEQRSLIDHESFLSFGVALTFFTLGVVGIIGSDDILCCFVVGNSFTWDDWFRKETEDHAFQDVIDQLLNSAIFLYIGAILPWAEFNQYQITPWRLVILGILVMLVRRLPWVVLMSRWIPSVATWREAVFAGFFGPIGVGAVFYVQVALEVLPDDGTRQHLRQVILPVVYFLVLTSIVVHGITIPIGKGFQRARTMTLNSNMSSRTNTRTEPNNVSRLPPPVPGPGMRNDHTVDSDRNSSEMRRVDGTHAIRFDDEQSPAVSQSTLPTTPATPKRTAYSRRSSRHADTDTDTDAGANGDQDAAAARPTHRQKEEQPHHAEQEAAAARPTHRQREERPHLHADDDRDTPDQMWTGETWREGRNIVRETEDGERVVVERV